MDVDYKGFSKALGERIRKFRKERGWKHSDIIANSGINDSQWRKYERGSGITAESMLKIAACFKMSVSDLLRGLGDGPIATPGSAPEAVFPVQATARNSVNTKPPAVPRSAKISV
ncbi:helix-turn-helix domain-containing protein [Granulicella tundricola]|uniref:Helix-turn-helix domain protein n=1 Tax=Granulicella tundricola (strain ATCC BAA-1859 / DSM 23138 / MP5ACTX9) TaxID=1198114 RepID=E8X7F3_GRATM|nr:helix-turn-helix transcriptional regulator [Granulicella tundricola]ADW71387.1 helix-turn-helix domain protein [Granulicella tundricola MP5ACTX9]